MNELQVFSRYFFLHNFVGFPDSRNMEDCATAVGISTASANPKTCRAVDAQVEDRAMGSAGMIRFGPGDDIFCTR